MLGHFYQNLNFLKETTNRSGILWVMDDIAKPLAISPLIFQRPNFRVKSNRKKLINDKFTISLATNF